jgi:hypothetical protein
MEMGFWTGRGDTEEHRWRFGRRGGGRRGRRAARAAFVTRIKLRCDEPHAKEGDNGVERRDRRETTGTSEVEEVGISGVHQGGFGGFGFNCAGMQINV